MVPDTVVSEEIEQHLGFVRRVARGLVLDPHLADDLSQSALLAALEQRPKTHAGLRAWLVGALRNLARVHYRSEARHRELRTPGASGRVGEGAIDVASPEESSFQTVERGEISERIVHHVMELEEPYRTVLLARYLDEKTPPEIALMLERPLETVQTQLRRGLQRMRVALDANHGGRREDWLAALLPWVGEKTLFKAVGLQSVGSSVGLVGAWRWLGAALLAVGAVLAIRELQPEKETSRQALARVAIDADESDEIGSVRSEESPIESRLSVESSASAQRSPEKKAAESRRVEQILRLVDQATGRPVIGARLTSLDFAPRKAKGTGSILKGGEATSRVFRGSSAFDFSAYGSRDPSAGYSVRLGHSRSDLAGIATLLLNAGGATRVFIEAEGFARGAHEIVTVEGAAPITLEVGRASGLEVQRGAAPSDAELKYILRNPIHDEVHRGVLYPGEARTFLSHLPAGLYDLQVRWGKQQRGGRSVLLEDGLRTSLPLWRVGPASLAVEIQSPREGEARPEGSLLVRSAANSGWRQIPLAGGTTAFRGLEEGLHEVELQIDGEPLVRVLVQVVAPSTVCPITLSSASLSVQYETDAVPSPYWSALLHGPLEKADDQRFLLRRDLERGRESLEASFTYLAPGSYDLWVLEDFEASRRRIQVGGEDLTVHFERDSTSTAVVEIASVSGASTQFEVGTASGVHLPFPYLSAGCTLRLPVGSYEILAGWPNAQGPSLSIEVANGINHVEIPELEPVRSVQLRALEAASGRPLSTLLLEGRPSMILGSPPQRRVQLEGGSAALSLAPGRYFACDAQGRRQEFEIRSETHEVLVQFE